MDNTNKKPYYNNANNQHNNANNLRNNNRDNHVNHVNRDNRGDVFNRAKLAYDEILENKLVTDGVVTNENIDQFITSLNKTLPTNRDELSEVTSIKTLFYSNKTE